MPARLSSMELSPSSNPEVDTSTRPSRRKSGRVVKAPELLIAEGGSKRKRGQDDDIEDESPEEELEDSEEGEPDEEEVKAKRRATKRTSSGKTAPKRAKTTVASTTNLPIRSAPRAKPKKPRKVGQVRQSAIGVGAGSGATGLYAEVFTSEANLDDVVAEWLGRFKVHQTEALAEIINFVLRCAGCPLEVNAYDIEDPDNCANRLTDMQEEFQTHNISEYPLIDKSKNASVFKKALSGFFSSFISSIAATNMLWDNIILIENIQSWIGTMSSASYRPFRHTAAFTSFSIISAFCELARELTNSRAKILRQEEGEKKKKGKVNQARVKSLQEEAKVVAERKGTLDEVIVDWFKTVFVHRYRDIDARIRLDALGYLGDWLMTYPELFLDGVYLRYLGWELSDTSAPARQEAVKQILRVVKDETKVAGVRVFTERFRARIVEMAVGDAEPSVRVSAVDLLDALRIPGLLEPDDIDTVGKLIYDSEPRVRKAVIPFFVASVDEIFSSKVDELGGEELVEEAFPADAETDFTQPQLTWLRLKSLAELLNSFDPEDESQQSQDRTAGDIDNVLFAGENESRTTLAAQAIFPKMPDLKNWEILAGYLLYDHSQTAAEPPSDDIDAQFKTQCKLEEREEIVLLDVLNVSVRSELGDIASNTTEKKGKKPTKAELRELQLQQESAAQTLAQVIPRLLKKFGAAPEAASAVLRLEHGLNLEVFEQLRQDSTTYAALLDDINKQFMSHESRAVLREASNALQHAKSFEELGEVTDEKLRTLWDQTIQSLIALCKGEELTARGGMDTSVLKDVVNCLLRISHLSRISDCTQAFDTARQSNTQARRKQPAESPTAPISLFVDMLGRGRPGSRMVADVNAAEDTLVSHAMSSLLFYFMWKISSLRSTLAAGRTPSSDEITTLTERRNTVANHLDAMIAKRPATDSLRVTAAGTLLDLHNMFIAISQVISASPSNLDSDAFGDLIVDLSPPRQKAIEAVFSTLEKDFAKKSGHELEASTEDDEPEPTMAEDADPVSDDEEEEEEVTPEAEAQDEDSQRRKAVRDARKNREALLAEEQLCTLASKVVISLRVGVIEREQSNGRIRKRLVRNRAKLGHNFKEIVAALESKSVKGEKGTKSRNKAPAKAGKGDKGKAMKSAEVVVSDDEEEDDVEQAADEGDEDALRARGLVVDEEPVEDAAMDGVDAGEGEGEVESIVGD